MELALPVAGVCFQRACCAQALPPPHFKGCSFVFSLFPVSDFNTTGEQGADHECNLAAAAARPVPQVQDLLCQGGN